MRKIEKNKQFFLPLPVSSALPVSTTRPPSHATPPILNAAPSQTQWEEESELANTNQHKKDTMSTKLQYSIVPMTFCVLFCTATMHITLFVCSLLFRELLAFT